MFWGSRMETLMTAFRSIVFAIAVSTGAGGALAQHVRSGPSAFGDWSTDDPGVTRRISADDLPQPGQTAARRDRAGGAHELRVPQGFAVARFSQKLDGVRVVRVAPNGDVFAARTRGGVVEALRPSQDSSRVAEQKTYASGLQGPFGIAFWPPGPNPQWVYVAETTRVVRFPYHNGDMTASGRPEVVISGIPGGGHTTRDIAFSPDGGTLYVSIGSASNVAEGLPRQPDLATYERTHGIGASWGPEEWRASVVAFDPDGKNRRPFANGIRNCAGLAVEPNTGAPWCATNERDMLGDNLPPDYVTSVRQGGFYGWPWWYLGAHQDPRHVGARADLRDRITVPDVLVQAHSAPLGLAFNTGDQFGTEWKGDAFVALHGSWNRSTRTGYKIVRLPMRDGKATGDYQDFVVGFAAGDNDVWGRPVATAFLRDGSMIFTDDMGGLVWRVSRGAR